MPVTTKFSGNSGGDSDWCIFYCCHTSFEVKKLFIATK